MAPSDTSESRAISRDASSCAWKVPSSVVEYPAGSVASLISLRMSPMILAMSEPSVLARTTMRRRVLSRRIWLGPSVSTIWANDDSGTRPAGVSTISFDSPSVVRSGSASRSTTSWRRLPSMICETTRPFSSVSSVSVTCDGVTPNMPAFW